MRNLQIDSVGSPKIGNYQYSVDESILGYCDSKEEARQLATDKAMTWVLRFSHSCMWHVGVVVDIQRKVEPRSLQRSDGSGTHHDVYEHKTAVAVSMVAFGCVSSVTREEDVPTGVAQGRAR